MASQLHKHLWWNLNKTHIVISRPPLSLSSSALSTPSSLSFLGKDRRNTVCCIPERSHIVGMNGHDYRARMMIMVVVMLIVLFLPIYPCCCLVVSSCRSVRGTLCSCPGVHWILQKFRLKTQGQHRSFTSFQYAPRIMFHITLVGRSYVYYCGVAAAAEGERGAVAFIIFSAIVSFLWLFIYLIFWCFGLLILRFHFFFKWNL